MLRQRQRRLQRVAATSVGRAVPVELWARARRTQLRVMSERRRRRSERDIKQTE
jgi:hypothetical protein